MIKKYWIYACDWIVLIIYHPIKWAFSFLAMVFYILALIFTELGAFFTESKPRVLGVLMLIFAPRYAKYAYKKGYEAGLVGKRKPYTYQFECDRWAFAWGYKRGCKNTKDGSPTP